MRNKKKIGITDAGTTRAGLLIHGGRLIDPSQKLDALMDVWLREGRVAEVAAPGGVRAEGAERIDAAGLVVAPGLIDVHVHLREPGQSHKETISTGTMAAAAGGFTSVCCMPNTQPVNDLPELTHWMLARERGAVVNLFPIAAATVDSAGERRADFDALYKAGAVAFSDDGKPILEDAMMRECLRAAAKLGAPVIQHAEDTRVTQGCSMNLSPASFRLGLRGMSAESESGIVERDIRLARETGGHLHVAHLSTRKALDAVRRARNDGVHVTCEVAPHHFTLIDEHVGEYDANFKMCPPLRSADDREAMIEGLLDGSVDAIATDHAPHALHEKLREFERAPMGITGLETALGISIQALRHNKSMSLLRIIELLSTGPAQLMGLKDRGTLRQGAHGDITLFNPKRRWTFFARDSLSKSKNTPYDGWELTGQVSATIVGGRIIFQRS